MIFHHSMLAGHLMHYWGAKWRLKAKVADWEPLLHNSPGISDQRTRRHIDKTSCCTVILSYTGSSQERLYLETVIAPFPASTHQACPLHWIIEPGEARNSNVDPQIISVNANLELRKLVEDNHSFSQTLQECKTGFCVWMLKSFFGHGHYFKVSRIKMCPEWLFATHQGYVWSCQGG